MPSIEHQATAVGLTGLGLFQLGVAAGAPWGRACYGGSHHGVLPGHLRAVSAGGALVYAGLTWAVASPQLSLRQRRGLFAGITGVMGVATIVNGISPSLPERALWTPTSAMIAVTAWRARQGQ